MKNNDDCAILVCSCDAYSDIWDVFFDLLDKFWKDIPYKIFLSTETKEYKHSKINVNVINNFKENISWTERIYETLNKIKEKHVIFLLDDFFLYDNVQVSRIKQCLEWLKDNKKIATFTFLPTSQDGLFSKYDGFEKKPKVSKYKVAAIAGIWNKNHLLKYLEKCSMNAWQWEVYANDLSNTVYKNDEFYIEKDDEPRIFSFDINNFGLFSGKWTKKSKEIFDSLGIKIDFEKRGFYDERLRGLSPSIINGFRLDSAIIPYYQLKKKKNILVKCNKNITIGSFNQDYQINGAHSMIRWEPSTLWGFAIKNLSIVVCYIDNVFEEINNKDLFGSFLLEKDLFIFNSPNPNLYIPTIPKKIIKNISISGYLELPLNEELLKKGYNYFTVTNNKKHQVLYDKIWDEFLIIPEKSSYIKFNPSIRTQQNGLEDTTSSIEFSGKKFKCSYNINEPTEFIDWKATNSVGYAIKNLKILLCFSNRKIKVDIDSIENVPKTIKKHIVFWEDDSIKIYFTNEKPDKIIICGYFVRPIPNKILYESIYNYKKGK